MLVKGEGLLLCFNYSWTCRPGQHTSHTATSHLPAASLPSGITCKRWAVACEALCGLAALKASLPLIWSYSQRPQTSFCPPHRLLPSSGPLHVLFPLPGIPSFTSSFRSQIQVTSSGWLSLTAPSEATPAPVITLFTLFRALTPI